MRELDRLRRRIESAKDERYRLVTVAERQGIPKEWIASHAGLAKKTVYRRLEKDGALDGN